MSIRSERLDGLLSTPILGGRPVSVVKLDIQGAELGALRGAEALVETYRPVLIVEADEVTTVAFGYSPRDLCAYLESLRYSLFGISEKRGRVLLPFTLKSHEPVPHDLVCIPEHRLHKCKEFRRVSSGQVT